MSRGKYIKNLSQLDLYNEYKIQYEKSAKQLSRHGKSPRYEMMDFTSFVHDYNEEFGDIKAMAKEKGTYSKLSAKQIAQKMAKDDAYYLSTRQITTQASAIHTYSLENDSLETISEATIRRNLRLGLKDIDDYIEGFWDMVKVTTKDLRAQGSSWDEIKLIIGQEYFGSL